MSLNQSSFAWHDGGIKPLREVAVSPSDRAYLTGFGVFETMHAIHGSPFAITRHWQRLCQSCEVLGIQPPDQKTFREAVHATIIANHLHEDGKQARVRCTVSPVSGDNTKQSMLISVIPAEVFPKQERIAIIDWPKNEHSPLSRVKCVSYAENALAKQKLMGKAGEGIWSNTAGEICEGTATNVFFVLKGSQTLLTPPLQAGCLPGVIRGLILELAEKNGIPYQQRTVPIANFKEQVTEAFLTSSTRYVQAVSHVDELPLRECPGELTRVMADLLADLVANQPDP